MENGPSVTELERRWERVLRETQQAVHRHPDTYRRLKSMAGDIVTHPVDIREYLPTAKKLACLLQSLDPDSHGSIFSYFNARVAPSSVWQVAQLRMECRDLLDHLAAFDRWRRATHHLERVK